MAALQEGLHVHFVACGLLRSSFLLVPSILQKPKWVQTLDLNVDGASLTVALLSAVKPVQTPIYFHSSVGLSCD